MAEVVIVGGGIVGLACAYEMAKAGARVRVVEYGKTAMQATNAAAGILAPMIESHGPGPMLELGVRALREMPALVDELQAQAGFDVELRLDGILKVAFEEEQLRELQKRQRWLGREGHEVDALDAAQCREAEPRISERVVGGMFSAGEGSVSNQLLALALERAAMGHGAEIRQGSPVVGFRTSGGRVTVVRTRTEDVACDAVVIAAGARSGQVAAKLSGTTLPVRPIRGQMVALGGMSCPIRSVVWGPEGYLVPRVNGLVFAGATVEDVGFRRRTTKRGVARLRRMAARLVPQLGSAQQQFEWAGLRPGTPDGLPMIGPLAGWSNVVAATGHYRNGILLGPITGQLVAAGILQDNWSETPADFRPDRFAH